MSIESILGSSVTSCVFPCAFYVFFYKGAEYLHTPERPRWAVMASRTPQFKVGEQVCLKFPTIDKEAEKGVFTDSYEFIGQHRYIVACESGRKAVFFEQELVQVAFPSN